MDQQCGIHALRADVVVQDDGAILLLRPRTPPNGAEGWRLPEEALRFGEAPAACARRILVDQLGLGPERVALVEVESSVVGTAWSLIFHFRCDADRPPDLGPAIAEARFFQVEHLPPTAHGDWERDVIYRVIVGGGFD